MELFTIGHSNHEIETFIALLHQHGVTALADVRSHPYSRYVPQFNQSPLRAALQDGGIRYVFLGRELGARAEDANCYLNGKAVYEKIAETQPFAEGIQRLVRGSATQKIALMCAEKDPITCHRAILVCQHLRPFNLEIHHILRDGGLESHIHLEERLLEMHSLKLPEPLVQEQLSLFDETLSPKLGTLFSSEQALREAYQRQGDRIAYIEKPATPYEQVS
ncbi:DUF488 domain-containing protein [Kovacikia minuta CCNUW1]|uniref:DUF488 domain-containing protein n=1 Tax=Kovacikia minuta TaxID=2931930 RepID=UPI001CCB54BD|nr:DUF488 domain-containing protein [Kovacikia minuta]UBF26717.1 DUF488 domain-containing protein [Kovacikia minuta CCNUW1]